MPSIATMTEQLEAAKAAGSIKPVQSTQPTAPAIPSAQPADGLSRGPLPTSFVPISDQLREWDSKMVLPGTRVPPLPAVGNLGGNAAATSSANNAVAPVAAVANQANSTATQAGNTATAANNTANTANTTANNALPTPQNLSYRPLSNPLTSVDDGGGTAEIDIASFTLRVRSKTQLTDVVYNSGTITGLSNTAAAVYYVYFTDAAFAGGTVTYLASLTKTDSLSNSGNIYIGSILIAASGGSQTIGNNDGGVGGQSGGQIINWPSAVIGTTGWTNPTFAFDADPTTEAHSTSTATMTLGLMSSAVPPGATGLTLVLDILTNLAPSLTVKFSANGGVSFTTIYAPSTTGVRTVHMFDLTAFGFPLTINPGVCQIQFLESSGSSSDQVFAVYLLYTY